MGSRPNDASMRVWSGELVSGGALKCFLPKFFYKLLVSNDYVLIFLLLFSVNISYYDC